MSLNDLPEDIILVIVNVCTNITQKLVYIATNIILNYANWLLSFVSWFH